MHPLTLFFDVCAVCYGLVLGGLGMAAAAGLVFCGLGAIRRSQAGRDE